MRSFLNILAASIALAGSILLAFSLTVTSSTFRPVATNDGGTLLCFDGRELEAGYGGGLVLTKNPCPDWERAKPVAIILANHESFVTWGIILLGLCFLLQLLSEIGSKLWR